MALPCAHRKPLLAATLGFLLVGSATLAVTSAANADAGPQSGSGTAAFRTQGAATPLGWSKGTLQAELDGADGASGDAEGYSVALSATGSVALVGAEGKASQTGAAYVFTRSAGQWVEAAELTASNGAEGDQFGHSVSLSADGTIALVGASHGNDNTGAAYIFTEIDGTWSQTAELTASDGADGDSFGYAAALSAKGTTAVIGDLYQSDDMGAAYVFSASGGSWAQVAELSPSDGADGDYFGGSVAISRSGSTVLIGAYGQALETGAAYVFTDDDGTWTQQAKLVSSDAAEFDEFGYSVSITGNGHTAVTGSQGHNNDTGAAYIFTDADGTWSQVAELGASDGLSKDDFGDSVAISANGTTMLVGAFGRATLQGAAYVFTDHSGSWKQMRELTASDGAMFASYGWATALSHSGKTAVVGAIGQTSRTGATYAYRR